ncbi:MAG: RluA family pseudouridine synthase [Kiritimatiellae bacterium]|nr:RluA family pseudouridine synthase [Kiritimatiellia bacterium]
MSGAALAVLYEDEDVIVVDKPSGRIVHPAPGHADGALSSELVARYPEMASVGSAERPGVVHRLDIETSGVMVFARTRRAYLALRRAFESHCGVVKKYLAVVHGVPREKSGTVATPVGGRRAVSHWTLLRRSVGVSMLEFEIETGRTHQIRIHAASMGHPVVGDAIYGDAAKDRSLQRRPGRLLLHAVELAFPHPATGRTMVFASPPPPEILAPR